MRQLAISYMAQLILLPAQTRGDSSLVIPTIFITLALDLAGAALTPEVYAGRSNHDMPLLRILISLAYLNQVWSMSIMSFSNVPYWSICYEMWYYILFAILLFTKAKLRITLLLLCAILIGPKILLLAPIWLLGVFLQRNKRLQQLHPWQAWFLFLISWPLYGLYLKTGVNSLVHQWLLGVLGQGAEKFLGYSHYFLTDYLLAIIVAANFVGARGIARHFGPILLPCEQQIRRLSAYTFSIYLLHMPFILFYMALFNEQPGPLFAAKVLAASLFSIVLVSKVTEQQRHRWRAPIQRWLSALRSTSLFARLGT
ncbi:acyltransferase [Massilia sp. BJB1822]|uniref:acyltransferase family protein n=1 Tax=Massilia sp. BJB1822 TaxID=2744470 RepID=UPI001592C507|nr:acyltransferase family protein [Massilia sp. BJB1822]NVE00017.1 hypothetical protein [Massilia sp. BJB1822]